MHDFDPRIELWLRLIHCSMRRYIRNEDDAADAAQNLVLKLLMSKSIPISVSTRWLQVVVRNAAIDFIRVLAQRNRFEDHSFEVDTVACVAERDDRRLPYLREPAIDHCDSQLLNDVREAMSSLSRPMRKAITLYAHGFSYEGIAILTKTKPGTVRSRIHYARRQLLQRIAQ